MINKLTPPPSTQLPPPPRPSPLNNAYTVTPHPICRDFEHGCGDTSTSSADYWKRAIQPSRQYAFILVTFLAFVCVTRFKLDVPNERKRAAIAMILLSSVGTMFWMGTSREIVTVTASVPLSHGQCVSDPHGYHHHQALKNVSVLTRTGTVTPPSPDDWSRPGK